MAQRTYAQYCGIARALDIVGERWTLLIVRELLIRPARYGELAAALPGIATNLLAQRLRTLEDAGVVERRLDPGRQGVVYALTAWGSELGEPLEALARWSTPLMAAGRGTDHLQGHWLVLALRALLSGRSALRPATLGIAVDGVLLEVTIDADGTRVALADTAPATVLHAAAEPLLGLASGSVPLSALLAAGALEGDPATVDAVLG